MNSITRKPRPVVKRISDIIDTVLRGNRRSNVDRSIITVYPTNASEAQNPQRVRRSK
jgi:hypothetical protein